MAKPSDCIPFLGTDDRLALVAAMWPCNTLLRAILETTQGIQRDKDRLRPVKRALNFQVSLSVLEAAVYGQLRADLVSTKWHETIRSSGEWRISQRLDTIKILLGGGIKPERQLKRTVRELKARQIAYFSLVDSILREPSNIRLLDNAAINASRSEQEFLDLCFVPAS
jgi:hypothetical protein